MVTQKQRSWYISSSLDLDKCNTLIVLYHAIFIMVEHEYLWNVLQVC